MLPLSPKRTDAFVPLCRRLCIRLVVGIVAFCIGKTKRRLHDRKMEHFKSLTITNHASAVADHMTLTGHKIKWDHLPADS